MFRTPIGFHDALVAAPSQKAALEAWGAESNLFAAGVAEQVTDAALMDAALARPGEVVRVLRGSVDEQVAALGEAEGRPSPGPSRLREGGKIAPSRSREGGKKGEGPSPPPSPARGRGGKKAARPRRGAVDRAEAAVARAEVRHRAALAKLREEEAALQRRRRALEDKQRGEREALSAALEKARTRYRAAMAKWAG